MGITVQASVTTLINLGTRTITDNSGANETIFDIRRNGLVVTIGGSGGETVTLTFDAAEDLYNLIHSLFEGEFGEVGSSATTGFTLQFSVTTAFVLVAFDFNAGVLKMVGSAGQNGTVIFGSQNDVNNLIHQMYSGKLSQP